MAGPAYPNITAANQVRNYSNKTLNFPQFFFIFPHFAVQPSEGAGPWRAGHGGAGLPGRGGE